MRQISKLIIFLIMTTIFTSCARVEAPKLPANYFYEGSYIDIHSPDQEGWSLVSKSNKGMIFGKYGKEKGSSFIANVIFFPLPKEPKDKNEFLSLIKEGAQQNTNKNRFDKIKSNFTLYEKRKYMCVMASSLMKDKEAKVSLFTKKELFMEIKSLYCKDPKATQRALMIGYSYRGSSIYSGFDAEADSFINGIEFPEYK